MPLAELVRAGKWKEALEYLISHRDEARLLSEALGKDFPDFVYRVAHNALLEGANPREVFEAVRKLAPSEENRILQDIDDYLADLMIRKPDEGTRLYRELSLSLPKSGALYRVLEDSRTRRLLSLVLAGDFEGAEKLWEGLSDREKKAFLTLFDSGVLRGKEDFLKGMEFYKELHALEQSKSPEEILRHLDRISEIVPSLRETVSKIKSILGAKTPGDVLAVLRSLQDGWKTVAGILVLSVAENRPGLINREVVEELRKAGIDVKIAVPKIDAKSAFVAALYDSIVSLIRRGRYDEAYLLINKYKDVLSKHYVKVGGQKIPADEYLLAMLMYTRAGLGRILGELSNVDWKNLYRYGVDELERIRSELSELLSHRDVLEMMRKLGLLDIDLGKIARLMAAVEYAEGVKLLEEAENERNPERASEVVEKARKLLEDSYRYLPEAAVPLEEIRPSWDDIRCVLEKLGISTSLSPLEYKITRGML